MEFLVFIFGLIIGSFLNVCIYRMPLEQSVVTPARSFCPRCKKQIAWYDNIPVLSYMVLGGKCRNCKDKVSFLYPFVELLTGLSFLGLYVYYGMDALLIPYVFMVACFIVALVVDFGHRIIPDEISIGGMYFGLAFSLCIPAMHPVAWEDLAAGRWVMWILVAACFIGGYICEFFGPKNEEEEELPPEPYDWVLIFVIICLVVDLAIKFGVPVLIEKGVTACIPHLISLDAAIIGVLVGGGSIYLMGVLGDLIFRKDSMGGGDVKLLAMIGAFLGLEASILTFFIAPFFGAVYGIAEKIRTKDTAIAYGPFLVLGALICLFYQDLIIEWLFFRYDY